LRGPKSSRKCARAYRWGQVTSLEQISGGPIGAVTYAITRGDEKPRYLPAEMRQDRKWRLAPITFPPDSQPIALSFKFWWEGAERTVTWPWPTEERIGTIDQDKNITCS
jgi:hypothetical protein